MKAVFKKFSWKKKYKIISLHPTVLRSGGLWLGILQWGADPIYERRDGKEVCIGGSVIEADREHVVDELILSANQTLRFGARYELRIGFPQHYGKGFAAWWARGKKMDQPEEWKSPDKPFLDDSGGFWVVARKVSAGV